MIAVQRRVGAGPLPRSDAARLIGLVQDCRVAGISRRALLLRLSTLPEERTPPHHFRLARDALEPLLGADRAQLFALPTRDLALVWRGDAGAALQRSLDALRLLFADTELVDLDALTLVLDLPMDSAILLREIRPRPNPTPVTTTALTRVLDPATLAALETALAQASIDRFLRRQTICAHGADGFEPAWERRSLSIAELFETLVPDCNPHSEPWLLRRLGRSLDRRLLSSLCAGDELRHAGPFGIELNTASILGPEFLKFDALLPWALRGQVIIGLRPADILSDLPGFQFARDFARSRGYRLLLRGKAALLPLLPPERLGLDLLYMPWSEALAAPALLPLLPDPACLVLGGVDHGAAVGWARRRGVVLQQGKLVRPALR